MSEPPITRLAAHMSGYQGGILRIVHHDEEMPERPTTAEDCAAYFASPGAGGSAHYLTDCDSEQHCVPDSRVAWHAPPNSGSIGIEQSGYSRQCRAEWLDDYSRSNLARTCARTAELAVRFAVPLNYICTGDVAAGQRGITGHVNVSQAFRQSDHSDPGSGYPWDLVIPLCREGARLIGSPAAVKDFQAAHGLVVDGDPGIRTVLALGSVLRPVLDRLADTRPSPSVPRPTTGNRFANMPVIQYGATGSPVQALQDALNKVSGVGLAVDWQFGPATRTAVLHFQAFFKLTVDGIVGPQTWGLLDYLLDLRHL